MKKTAISFFFFLSVLSFTTPGQSTESLKLGVVPFKSPRTVVELYTPIASLLAKELGRTVQVVTANGYEQYMDRIYAGHYDIIVLGSTFYFKAHDKAGYQAVARGYPSFHAGIIVLKDCDVDTIRQLRGKSMAAVNKQDRGGYKLQKMALFHEGIHVENDLQVHFRGDFDSVIYAVLNGQDVAGAIRLDALQKPAFSKIKNKFKIIYTSPKNPQFPFAVSQDMDPALREKIGDILISITMARPETAAILKNLHILGIKRITSNDLELLRQARQKENKDKQE